MTAAIATSNSRAACVSRRWRIAVTFAVAVAGLLGPARTVAQPLDEFSMRVGGFVTHLDTTIRADDPSGRRGTEVDFERELGLDDRDVIEFIGMAWRPWRRHEFGLNYFHETLSGGRRLERELVFRGELFEVNAAVYSALTLESFEFHYTYWAYMSERLALGLRLGHLDYRIATRIEVLASDSDDPLQPRLRVTTSNTIPAPSIGIDLNVALAEKWRFNASVGWLEADLDRVSPLITTARAGLEYLAWERVGVWADFALNRVRADYRGDTLGGKIEIREGGLRLGVTYRL